MPGSFSAFTRSALAGSCASPEVLERLLATEPLQHRLAVLRGAPLDRGADEPCRVLGTLHERRLGVDGMTVHAVRQHAPLPIEQIAPLGRHDARAAQLARGALLQIVVTDDLQVHEPRFDDDRPREHERRAEEERGAGRPRASPSARPAAPPRGPGLRAPGRAGCALPPRLVRRGRARAGPAWLLPSLALTRRHPGPAARPWSTRSITIVAALSGGTRCSCRVAMRSMRCGASSTARSSSRCRRTSSSATRCLRMSSMQIAIAQHPEVLPGREQQHRAEHDQHGRPAPHVEDACAIQSPGRSGCS